VRGHGACSLGGGGASSLFVLLGLARHTLLNLLQLRIANAFCVRTHSTRQGVVLTDLQLLVDCLRRMQIERVTPGFVCARVCQNDLYHPHRVDSASRQETFASIITVLE